MENHPPSPFVGVQKEERAAFWWRGLPETAFLFLYPPVRPRARREPCYQITPRAQCKLNPIYICEWDRALNFDMPQILYSHKNAHLKTKRFSPTLIPTPTFFFFLCNLVKNTRGLGLQPFLI